MGTEHTFEISPGVVLIGEIVEQDDSFDCQDRRNVVKGLVVQNLHVFMYVYGIDDDVTSAILPKRLEFFEHELLENYIKLNGEAAA